MEGAFFAAGQGRVDSVWAPYYDMGMPVFSALECAVGCFTKTPFLEIHIAQSWFLVLDIPIIITMGVGGPVQREEDIFKKNKFSDISVSIGPTTKNQVCAIWISKIWFMCHGL